VYLMYNIYLMGKCRLERMPVDILNVLHTAGKHIYIRYISILRSLADLPTIGYISMYPAARAGYICIWVQSWVRTIVYIIIVPAFQT
jgi:hypothetical protein